MGEDLVDDDSSLSGLDDFEVIAERARGGGPDRGAGRSVPGAEPEMSRRGTLAWMTG
jgi:hypothetical protein